MIGFGMLGVFSNGIEDLKDGLKMQSVWIALAGEDITDQHRRTTLGPNLAGA